MENILQREKKMYCVGTNIDSDDIKCDQAYGLLMYGCKLL